MTSDTERWLTVPDYPDYEVSDQGRVRSLDRVGRSRWGTPRIFKGQILSQALVGGVAEGRYHACTLYCDGNSRQRTVHALVLETFVGPRPEGLYGCHRNDNPDDNRLENLYWGTPAQNSRDMVDNGLCWKSKITHCPQGHEYTEENTYVVAKSGHRQCRTCTKDRAVAKKTMPHSADRTHCPQGHSYTGDNLVINSQGRRTCRECTRRSGREYQRRKKLAQLGD